MTSDITSDLATLAERQRTGGFTPASSNREEQLAAVLISTEGARQDYAHFVARWLMESLAWPQHGGAPTVVRLDGSPDPDRTVASVLAEVRSTFPFAFGGGPVSAQPVSEQSSTFKPDTLTARAKAEAARQAGQSKAENTAPNLWKAGTINPTRQAILENNDPSKAAKQKAEASK